MFIEVNSLVVRVKSAESVLTGLIIYHVTIRYQKCSAIKTYRTFITVVNIDRPTKSNGEILFELFIGFRPI